MCADSPDERDSWLVALTCAAHDDLPIVRRYENDEQQQHDEEETEGIQAESKRTDQVSVCSYNVNFGLCDLG